MLLLSFVQPSGIGDRCLGTVLTTVVHNKTHKVRNRWVHSGKACWEKAIGSFLSRF